MRRYSLGDEPTENLQGFTTAEERLAMSANIRFNDDFLDML
jgi:hypothetical protein